MLNNQNDLIEKEEEQMVENITILEKSENNEVSHELEGSINNDTFMSW